MRSPWIDSRAALEERLAKPFQVAAEASEAAMPPYMESFLAHLRLLIGVPFEYLVPDARLLPVESIRFFYLDRSWTDRLVDGAVSVGKIGTREQAHHHARDRAVRAQLDQSERVVRVVQRGLRGLEQAKAAEAFEPADLVTGFLLRSAAVSGWPHMEVRAFRRVVAPRTEPRPQDALKLLRLERLAPAVLLALFQGVPELVWCEEPHHGVQFGVEPTQRGFQVLRRDTRGHSQETSPVTVPVRQANRRVVAVAELRRRLDQAAAAPASGMPRQCGSGDLALQLLDVPWRQRFQDRAGGKPVVSGATVEVSLAVAGERVHRALEEATRP